MEQDYDELGYDIQHVMLQGCLSALSVLLGFGGCLLLCAMCQGCAPVQYVPVETVKTEVVHQTDTVKETMTINNERETVVREARPEDSLLLAKMGIKLQANERLLILLQRELAEAKNELRESHNRDSVRADTVQVPVPVERQLSRWEQVCLDYGKVMAGASAAGVVAVAAVIVRWLRRLARRK